jgi:hypothetical protein
MHRALLLATLASASCGGPPGTNCDAVSKQLSQLAARYVDYATQSSCTTVSDCAIPTGCPVYINTRAQAQYDALQSSTEYLRLTEQLGRLGCDRVVGLSACFRPAPAPQCLQGHCTQGPS